MTAHIHPLNPGEAEGDGPTVGIHFLARELGVRGYGRTRLRAYITLLIDECGFPPPLPAFVAGKGDLPSRITREVTIGSRWRREPVEVWIDDFLPPDNAAAMDVRARRDAAVEMDRNACRLQLVRDGAA